VDSGHWTILSTQVQACNPRRFWQQDMLSSDCYWFRPPMWAAFGGVAVGGDERSVCACSLIRQ